VLSDKDNGTRNAHSLPSDMFFDCIKEIRNKQFSRDFWKCQKEKFFF